MGLWKAICTAFDIVKTLGCIGVLLGEMLCKPSGMALVSCIAIVQHAPVQSFPEGWIFCLQVLMVAGKFVTRFALMCHLVYLLIIVSLIHLSLAFSIISTREFNTWRDVLWAANPVSCPEVDRVAHEARNEMKTLFSAELARTQLYGILLMCLAADLGSKFLSEKLVQLVKYLWHVSCTTTSWLQVCYSRIACTLASLFPEDIDLLISIIVAVTTIVLVVIIPILMFSQHNSRRRRKGPMRAILRPCALLLRACASLVLSTCSSFFQTVVSFGQYVKNHRLQHSMTRWQAQAAQQQTKARASKPTIHTHSRNKKHNQQAKKGRINSHALPSRMTADGQTATSSPGNSRLSVIQKVLHVPLSSDAQVTNHQNSPCQTTDGLQHNAVTAAVSVLCVKLYGWCVVQPATMVRHAAKCIKQISPTLVKLFKFPGSSNSHVLSEPFANGTPQNQQLPAIQGTANSKTALHLQQSVIPKAHKSTPVTRSLEFQVSLQLAVVQQQQQPSTKAKHVATEQNTAEQKPNQQATFGAYKSATKQRWHQAATCDAPKPDTELCMQQTVTADTPKQAATVATQGLLSNNNMQLATGQHANEPIHPQTPNSAVEHSPHQAIQAIEGPMSTTLEHAVKSFVQAACNATAACHAALAAATDSTMTLGEQSSNDLFIQRAAYTAIMGSNDTDVEQSSNDSFIKHAAKPLAVEQSYQPATPPIHTVAKDLQLPGAQPATMYVPSASQLTEISTPSIHAVPRQPQALLTQSPPELTQPASQVNSANTTNTPVAQTVSNQIQSLFNKRTSGLTAPATQSTETSTTPTQSMQRQPPTSSTSPPEFTQPTSRLTKTSMASQLTVTPTIQSGGSEAVINSMTPTCQPTDDVFQPIIRLHRQLTDKALRATLMPANVQPAALQPDQSHLQSNRPDTSHPTQLLTLRNQVLGSQDVQTAGCQAQPDKSGEHARRFITDNILLPIQNKQQLAAHINSSTAPSQSSAAAKPVGGNSNGNHKAQRVRSLHTNSSTNSTVTDTPLVSNAVDSENNGDANICVICWDCKREWGYLHNGVVHACVCSKCKDVVSVGSACPVCRMAVEAVVRVCG